jgi:uncharacterized protein YidB (DUF937 family)
MAEGPNTPVSPAEVHNAFGEQTINELAAKSGLSTQELTEKLAQVLPHAVSAMPPNSEVPKT